MYHSRVQSKEAVSPPGRAQRYSGRLHRQRHRHQAARGRRSLLGANALPATVQPVGAGSELRQVAELRAEAYYEDNYSRFVETYKNQFVMKEIASLKERTVPQRGAPAPEVECLVALADDGMVLGCIDVCIPESTCGTRPEQVPAGEENSGSGYVKNVVVREGFRGQGVGRLLMLAALDRAVQRWRVAGLYTTVDADNEVAFGLYTSCGFREVSQSKALEGSSTLGSTISLRWQPAAPAAQSSEAAQTPAMA